MEHQPTKPLSAEWLTITATAKRLGISRGTVYRMLAAGQLTTRRIGARDLIRAADVAALLDGAA